MDAPARTCERTVQVPRRYRPTFEDFRSLAKRGNIVPVYRRLLADTLTPVSAFDKIHRGQYAFLLESASGGEKIARYSFLASAPYMRLKARGYEVEICKGDVVQRISSEDPIATLSEQFRSLRPVHIDGLPRFLGGAVGYAAYDAVRYIENLPSPPPDSLNVPDLCFGFYDTIIVFDHLNKTFMVVHNARTEGRDLRAVYDEAVARIDAVVELLRTPVTKLSDDIIIEGDLRTKLDSNFEPADFEHAVGRCLEYIRAGDIFQVVLSQRLSAETKAPPFDVYRALRAINPSPYMFYLHMDDIRLIGSSPEVMVKVEGRKATVRPIAGTRRRGRSEAEDIALAEELLNDPKERAEHVMLVDLGRNDIGRVARPGTVQIEEEMIIERFSHVMHMTSCVSGILRDELDAFDAFRAAFPAGTLSGAPKVRAMEILDELEPAKRGPYGGAVGYIDFSGNMDTCITIRTILLCGEPDAKGRRAYVQAGAGIVADSVPAREYEETINKAKGLFRAIEVAEEGLL